MNPHADSVQQPLTAEKLREYLRYDPETGYFSWLQFTRYVGKRAGYLNAQGYRRIELLNRGYQAHQLVWLYVHGELPPTEIDHLNGLRDDNRIENLRLASRFTNTQNVGLRSNNTTGFAGVTFYKPSKKWRAQINTNGDRIYLGTFDAPEQAHEAYVAAKIKYHAGFVRHLVAPESLIA
jgi:hypothetical protein